MTMEHTVAVMIVAVVEVVVVAEEEEEEGEGEEAEVVVESVEETTEDVTVIVTAEAVIVELSVRQREAKEYIMFASQLLVAFPDLHAWIVLRLHALSCHPVPFPALYASCTVVNKVVKQI
ncbi:hypothetical protein BD410DRAFT_48517 [Rickenella mellea]|uniref:Uncharacterized protein n=1 Tax=Rickenella mellea TaxID=50990 RepID=A0A4R5XFP5_9AGAM|nr:hypothetical protein BD410DRAFT_48517 [Rickenella mellea]